MKNKIKEVSSSPAASAGTVTLGGQLTVNRLGFGAMRLTGDGIWGPPKDRAGAISVLRRAVELGVNFIDTADSYGPKVSEELIAEAVVPYAGPIRQMDNKSQKSSSIQCSRVSLAIVTSRSASIPTSFSNTSRTASICVLTSGE